MSEESDSAILKLTSLLSDAISKRDTAEAMAKQTTYNYEYARTEANSADGRYKAKIAELEKIIADMKKETK